MKDFPARASAKELEAQLAPLWEAEPLLRWDPAAAQETDYVIDTPPPTVSGTLHVGHVYSYTQADILARYFRMSGRNVLYPIGWDDNGLPTERLVEKVKKVRGGNMPREDFVRLCREVIPGYEAQFKQLFSRLGLSVDWAWEYQTVSDQSRAVSQLSLLDLYEKGLLERRLQPTLWDPGDRTAIAQAEVEEIEREGKLYFVPFEVSGGETATIATTRPELIGACVALLIHPDHPRAADLVGRAAVTPLFKTPVPIIAEETVDLEKGTGIVMCSTFGDTVDIQWWRKHGLPLRVILDAAGRIARNIPVGSNDWPCQDVDLARKAFERIEGLSVEKARAAVVEALGEVAEIQVRPTTQVVPVAERSGSPLEIIVTPQWVIKTLDYKQEILAKGREIKWHPPHMRQRFEAWVEGLKWDWPISRQRHFGVPIPVWYSKRPGEEGKVLLPTPQALPVDPLIDLPHGYTREEVEPESDVMDTWATSSVSPNLITRSINAGHAFDLQLHQRIFPMALRTQAHEIIRTWAFYTIVKALHHEQSVPWREIAISGWCLAQDGSKMSKSRGNVIDPVKLLDQYGADAVRYWTGTSRLGHDTVLSENTLNQGKRLATKLWNAMRLAHQALQRHVIAPTTPREDLARGLIDNPIDQWILGQLAKTVQAATEALEQYEYARALKIAEDFFWRTYCDDYLEIVKRRVAEDVPFEEQRSALYALHHSSATILRLFAPYIPFISDELHQIFQSEETAGSIHARGQWPKQADQVEPGLATDIGDTLTEVMAAVRKAKSELGVSLKAPVDLLTLSSEGQDHHTALAKVQQAASADLKFFAVTETVSIGQPPADAQVSIVSANERFRISLLLAQV